MTFSPPTGRPWCSSTIKNTAIEFLSDAYADRDSTDLRWLKLREKIEKAKTYLKRNHSSDPLNTLKLFLSPEWFFRKKDVKQSDEDIQNNPNVTLTYVQPYTETDVIRLLNTIIKDSKMYPSWLIIPGTIYWAEKGNSGRWKTYNMAPVVYNGQLLSLVHKCKEADVWDTYEDWGNGTGDLATKLANAINTSNRIINKLGISNNIDRHGFFQCEGIKFALEICGDHVGVGGPRLFPAMMDILRPLITRLGGTLSSQDGMITDVPRVEDINPILDSNLVDIHLLVSCGSFPGTKSVARREGYFIQSDGSVSQDKPKQEWMFLNLKRIATILNVSQRGNQITTTFENANAHSFESSADNLYERVAIFDTLLDLNPASTADSITSATSATNS